MTGTTLERPDVAAYLDAVRAELADLPTEERDELVTDLEAQLIESGEPPRLPPREFAAELREAAGLTAVVSVGPALGATVRAWLGSRRLRTAWATARELAPIWWLARAYAAVAAAALILGQGWPIGSETSGNGIRLGETFGVFVAAGAISVWLGLRARKRRSSRRRLLLAADVALAVALVPVLAHSFDQVSFQRSAEVFAVSADPIPGLANNGQPIRNLYPYSRDGRLLHDVLLYDDRGMPVPIMIGFDDPLRRVLERPDGGPIRNSYPIRYYEPGTREVARPNLAPRVDLPEIATPPLARP